MRAVGCGGAAREARKQVIVAHEREQLESGEEEKIALAGEEEEVDGERGQVGEVVFGADDVDAVVEEREVVLRMRAINVRRDGREIGMKTSRSMKRIAAR